MLLVLKYMKNLVATLLTVGSLSNYDDDFKKKIVGLINDQNNSSARASRFLVHFFDVHCTTTTWNLLRRRISLPLFESE